MAEVTSIPNYLYILILSSKRLQFAQGIVRGSIVDKNVFVLVVAGAGDGSAHLKIQLAHIFLLVIAGRKNGEGLRHSEQPFCRTLAIPRRSPVAHTNDKAC